ncbi:MAG: hypothetical protein H0U74_05580 [Bradymonadaceae bacterium]|nr:hypothetical protein [Lujinxingiaceae bacterium]
MADNSRQLKHFVLANTASSHPYAYVGSGGSADFQWTKPRAHGVGILAQIQTVKAELEELEERRKHQGLTDVSADLIEFRVEITRALPLDSFEDLRAGIELVSFKIDASDSSFGIATVHVPEGKLAKFEAKLEDFLNPDKDSAKSGNPRPLPRLWA